MTKQQKATVEFTMGEFKRGKLRTSSGRRVTSRDQAIAIALSQAGLGYNSIPDPRKVRVMPRKKTRKKARKKAKRKSGFNIARYNKARRLGASKSAAKEYGHGRGSLAKATGQRKTTKKRRASRKKTTRRRVTRKKTAKRRVSRKKAARRRVSRIVRAATVVKKRLRTKRTARKGHVTVTAGQVLNGRIKPSDTLYAVFGKTRRGGAGGVKVARRVR